MWHWCATRNHLCFCRGFFFFVSLSILLVGLKNYSQFVCVIKEIQLPSTSWTSSTMQLRCNLNIYMQLTCNLNLLVFRKTWKHRGSSCWYETAILTCWKVWLRRMASIWCISCSWPRLLHRDCVWGCFWFILITKCYVWIAGNWRSFIAILLALLLALLLSNLVFMLIGHFCDVCLQKMSIEFWYSIYLFYLESTDWKCILSTILSVYWNFW